MPSLLQLQSGSALKLLENLNEHCRVAAADQLGNPCFWKLEFPETGLDLPPKAVSLFAFGEVEIGCQLGEPLELDGIEILVITVDDLALIRRVIGHRGALLVLELFGIVPELAFGLL
jgi:hypothetical protein